MNYSFFPFFPHTLPFNIYLSSGSYNVPAFAKNLKDKVFKYFLMLFTLSFQDIIAFALKRHSKFEDEQHEKSPDFTFILSTQ